MSLDHVQLAMPPGAEAEGDAFYAGLLGMRVDPKPEPLASRGGRWYSAGPVVLHLGAETDFRPARKAHPAVVVEDLDDLAGRLEGAGVPLRWDTDLPGVRRCHVEDPWGNRIELVDAGSAAS
jgi:catechol 2,3-dioxygenase-like lactoylglutathione lyase family enzyme